MSFRTIVIATRCKLEYSMNYLVCRGDDEKRINIDEISTIIVQNVGVSLTAALLSKLMEAKVKVIFCDPQSNPQGELTPFYSNDSNFERIKTQMGWSESVKEGLWRLVTIEKIKNQAKNLHFIGSDKGGLLDGYAEEVEPGDPTNREGHAAKVYFAACFSPTFTRDLKIPENAFLNYGYSIILSAINREVKQFGYLTEFGIHHIGVNNPFNLSCDLMEPLRPLIDFQVLSKEVTIDDFKVKMAALLGKKISYDSSEMFLDNAIHLYVQNCLNVLGSGKLDKVIFPVYELA